VTGDEYAAQLDALMTRARWLATADLEPLREHLFHAEVVAQADDPTSYARGASERIFLDALANFQAALRLAAADLEPLQPTRRMWCLRCGRHTEHHVGPTFTQCSECGWTRAVDREAS
jgi:hypothetical protein